MVRESVKETFERCATEYDRNIERIVPYYHDQHEIMLAAIPFPADQKIKILDLGTGTGVLGRILLRNFPNAFVDGVDFSERMLTVCSEMLGEFKGRFNLSCGDIETRGYDSDYDVVVAGLVLHHLTDDAKKLFFRRMYSSLNEHGVFIIRDIVQSRSERMNELYHRLWCAFERKNGIDPDRISENSKANDIPATMEDHLVWLAGAGFRDIDCVWKYNNFAVFVAFK